MKRSIKFKTFEQYNGPSTIKPQCTNDTHLPNKAPTSNKALTTQTKETGRAYQKTHRKQFPNMWLSNMRTRLQNPSQPNLHANDQQQSDTEQHGSLKLLSHIFTASWLPQASQPQLHAPTTTSSFITTAPLLYSVMTPPCSGPASGKNLLHGPDIIHPAHPSDHIKKQLHVEESSGE